MVVVADVGQPSLVVIDAVMVTVPDEPVTGAKIVGLRLVAKKLPLLALQFTAFTPPLVIAAVRVTFLLSAERLLQIVVLSPVIEAAVG
jgi:hypothetical protein